MSSWISHSPVYQIFPDRFAIGLNRNIHQKRELYPRHAIPRDWDHKPTRHPDTPREFLGGDLWGILEKLDYIERLGIKTVYLTPFFISPSNHKYDALDYKAIDPGMGDDEVFQKLIDTLHKKDMKLIIDLALNHVSIEHPYFQEALKDPHSKYRKFFRFVDEPVHYESWTGHINMPELNLQNPEVLSTFITGEDSVIAHWLRKGVDGIRLDCANDLGREVTAVINEQVKKINPEAYLIGEVSNFAAEWARILDGTQSYFVSHSIYSLLDEEISSRQFIKNIQDSYDEYGREKMCQSLVMLASHDCPRALDVFHHNRLKLKLGLLLQFTLPGVPMVYYGDENGMTGGHDPQNRAGMVWDESQWDGDLRDYYRQLIRIRNEYPFFQTGAWKEVSSALPKGLVAYYRSGEKEWEVGIVALNVNNKKKKVRIFIPYSHLYSNMILKDVFSGTRIKIQSSFIDIELAEGQGMLLLPEFGSIAGYRFYKGRP